MLIVFHPFYLRPLFVSVTEMLTVAQYSSILSNVSLFYHAGEIQCEQPNNSLYTFTGNLIVEKQTLPLSPDQLLLRV